MLFRIQGLFTLKDIAHSLSHFKDQKTVFRDMMAVLKLLFFFARPYDCYISKRSCAAV